MKEPCRETIVTTSSTKLIAGQKMAAGPPVKMNEPSGLVQVIGHNKYRIKMDKNAVGQSIFYCPKTGIKFEVESEATVEYSLEYGEDYVSLIQKLGYELLGPIFNVQLISGTVSVVHLPHYVCLEGFRDKSMIKFGHFKDGKVSLKIPSRIDPSYVVLEGPTFSCVAPLGEYVTSVWRRKKPFPFNGKVVIYARVLCPDNDKLKEFRIHLYLIPADRHILEKLDAWKADRGYKNIDKPGVINLFTKTDYIVSGEPTSNIWPETLQFMIHKEMAGYQFCEINIPHSPKEISLNVKTEKIPDSEPLWKGLLTRADIEELSGQAAQRAVSRKHFIDEHHSELIQKVKNIEPVLDDLKKPELLTEEQCGRVRSNGTSQEKMRELLQFVDGWGLNDKDTCLQALRLHNKATIQEISKGK